MPRTTPRRSAASLKIDVYIAKRPPWQRKILERLRRLIHRADPSIVEDWKWAAPAYSHAGLVCFTWGFKNWVSLTFFQGALINDRYRLFTHGKANDKSRTIKFTDASQVREAAISAYVKEAVRNNLAGRKVVLAPEPRRSLVLPRDVRAALVAARLLHAYAVRPYYQRKGYINWIEQVVRAETRKKRTALMLAELRAGTYMPLKRA